MCNPWSQKIPLVLCDMFNVAFGNPTWMRAEHDYCLPSPYCLADVPSHKPFGQCFDVVNTSVSCGTHHQRVG